MKYLKFSYLLLTSLLFACFGNTITFDKDNQISKFGQPKKIEYIKHLEGQAFNHDSLPAFTIENQTEIIEVLKEIKNANNPEPRKGAGWDRIVLTYNDTIIEINTNKRKIGLGTSGSFYDLGKNNFITRKLNIK